jgi:cysteinyl-tRNA synthetase
LALLSAHYRSPLNFSADLLEQARHVLDGFYTALRAVADIELDMEVVLAGEAFYAALNDDLNTPQAISEMHVLARELNKARDADKPRLKARLLAAGNLLGILAEDPEEWLQGGGIDRRTFGRQGGKGFRPCRCHPRGASGGGCRPRGRCRGYAMAPRLGCRINVSPVP